jgi:hypothetical protein
MTIATNVSAESIQPNPSSIADLLIRAKINIEASDDHMRQAAEDIAAAKEQGATQRHIAETLGKSAGWVSGLLRWRRDGYPGTTFARDKRPHVQPAEQQAVEGLPSAIEVERIFAAGEPDRLDAEIGAIIARVRKDQPDNEDVMFLCDYIEGDIGYGGRIPLVQKPDETAYTH